jgi:ectoine hydroxylase-related dioxygenase (phytanoyl-CoA dioxygenase family)
MEVVAFTKDWNPDPKAVYGKVHYDRRHQLKFILYLNDVNGSNGAFTCIPGSHKVGRQLFHQGWRKVLNLQTEDAREIEEAAAAIPEDKQEYLRVPCIVSNLESLKERVPQTGKLVIDGAAGTLVAFDSHLLHSGGMVTASHERWTLKGHTFAIAKLHHE